MHDYLFSSDVVRFAWAAGVVVSILLYERRHLTTGSIVVPGYIGVFVVHPLVIVMTFANALVTYWVINRLLPRWFVLYGRTKFTVLALTSISAQAMMLELSPTGSLLWESDVPLLVGAGYVIPALIAHDMARQGIRKTTGSVLLAGSIVAVLVAGGLLVGIPGVNDLAPLEGFGVLLFPPEWIPFAVVVSAGGGWGLLENHRLRSGGFVGAAYLGMLAGDARQVLFILVVAIATHLIVTKTLMGWMILFGRRKFAAMLLVGALASWTAMWLGRAVFGFEVVHYMTLSSVALTPLFVPGLVANDMERSSVPRVLGGLALGATFVVAATTTVEQAVTTSSVPMGRLAVSLALAAVIFRDQLIAVGAAAVSRSHRVVLGAGGRHHRPIEAVIRPDGGDARRLLPPPASSGGDVETAAPMGPARERTTVPAA